MTSSVEPRSTQAEFAARLSLWATVVVVCVKLVCAHLSGSVSVLSEALQSILDIVMSGVAVGAVRLASKPPDADHPYGHGKAEVLAGAVQMIVMMATAGGIIYMAILRLQTPEPVIASIGMVAMGYAVLSNTVVSSYLKRVAKETGSESVRAEALHLRADTIMSLGVLVGLVLILATGQTWLDPVVAIGTAIVGLVLASLHLKSLTHNLMDGSLPKAQVDQLEEILRSHPSAKGYHNLRTRAVGSDRFIDLHVMLEDNLTFVQAHDEAEAIEDELRAVLGGAIVSIHYEPFEAETAHRRAHHNQTGGPE